MRDNTKITTDDIHKLIEELKKNYRTNIPLLEWLNKKDIVDDKNQD